MAMVVTCRSCSSRFRLDEALLKDAKGARIRCRKCGGTIIVRNPEASPVSLVSPVPPASAVDPKVAHINMETPGDKTSPAPIESKTVGSDLSGRIRPLPSLPPPGEKAVPPTGGPAPAPPEKPERKSLLQEEFIFPRSATGAGTNSIGGHASKETGKLRPVWNASPRRPTRSRLLLVAGLSILLLAGGALYLGTTQPGKGMLDKLFSGWDPALPESAKRRPVYDFWDVKSRIDKGISGERIYIIGGTVANVGNARSQGIRIQATLLGKDNVALVKKAVFAGNLLDKMALQHMNRAGIDGFLGMRDGEGKRNRDIPVGNSLPFMVVFFEPPEEVESFTVQATDANEPGNTRPADEKEPKKSSLSQKTNQ